jgi:hypothetical protein
MEAEHWIVIQSLSVRIGQRGARCKKEGESETYRALSRKFTDPNPSEMA